MALKVAKADVWAVTIDDRAGGAAEKLEAWRRAARTSRWCSRAVPPSPGKGVMFVTPVKGAKGSKAAQEAGMGKPENIHSVRIEGGDKPGLGSKIARALGGRRHQLPRHVGAAIGSKFVSYIALDSADDQAQAIAALKKAKL